MSIITISRGSYSKGKETAEKLGRKLGYDCIGRDLLIEASKHFDIPEVRLIRALHDAPSILDRFTYGKERYVSFIRRELLERLRGDNVVYHGLAGHFFLKGVPHVFKVRIIANLEDRIAEEMRRENISEEKARQILVKDDYERRRWALHLYGIDTTDPCLYDMVLHVDKLKVDDVVEIIATAAKRPSFQTTPESQAIIDNMVLCAKAESALVDAYPTVKCSVTQGTVHVTVQESLSKKEKVEAKIPETLKQVEGLEEIRDIQVHIDPIVEKYLRYT